jgi:anti-anti-sigma factor
MAFEITTQMNGSILEITLSGHLDATSAPRLQQELTAAPSKPTAVVLRVGNLTYIASAGIRALIFAKQKLGAAVTLYVVAPQEQVLDTLVRTGLRNAVVVVDEYPVAS